MKIKNIFLLVAVISILAACKKDPDIGPYPDKVQGLSGTWLLTNVVQIDFTDPANRSKNISSFFLSENLNDNQKISFGAGPQTFTVTEGVKGPNLLGEPGGWSFDDDRFPTKILINRDGQIFEWRLSSPTRPQDDNLRITLVNQCNGQDYVGYRFEFVRN